MRQQPLIHVTPDNSRGIPLFSATTERHQAAVSELKNAFVAERPVSILIGDGKIETSHIVSAFHASLPEDVMVVRLRNPHADALTAMQDINRALGFEPSDLCLTDMKKILVLFLQHQKKHRCRTVMCVEQADSQALWLLDTIASLVDCDDVCTSGLFIVLTGSDQLESAPADSPLGYLRTHAGQSIRLAPFTLSETREFVRQRVEATGDADVSRIFDFDAVDRLHRLSGGKSDTVARLCHESLLLTDPAENGAVTPKIVTKAARGLHLEAAVDLTMTVVNTSRLGESVDADELLIVRWNGGSVKEIPVTIGRFMVGRTSSADILLPSLKVSRRHALIIKTAQYLQVLDLGSTNGTFIKDRRIKEYCLSSGDIVRMGDCEIEYFAKL